ncbi:hypothetical protein NA57DRAFT_77387 [Rhizodiscina lignyota]|uniref:RTA1 domain protein n=1 Tax=Rhizodiscina lignyota TaxID=1504668 RepID=A0A9P4ICF1_9PEZI|nr:hypothetical protein NA57DRAFT_77387 [Rhizodiscina lignyota]
MNELVPRKDPYAPGSVYWYAPNKAAPIAFTVLFFLSGVVHFYQNFRYKSWKITPFLPWAAILMTAGFAVREAGAHDDSNVGLLIASIVLIMSGPPVYAAINYIVFCRCLYYVPYMSPIHPVRVLVTFLGIDSLIEILIGNGASRMANTSAPPHFRQVGEDLTKSALIIQAVFFIVFIVIGLRFQHACRKKNILNKNLNTVLYVMYASCLLITARCIYRIVEFFQGYTGEIYDTEWYFWVFEATLMFINTVMLNIWHPGRYLPAGTRTFLGVDGVERVGPGWEDTRPVLLKIFDACDIVGLFMGHDNKNRYWEWEPAELEAYVARQKAEKEEKKRQRKEMFSRSRPKKDTQPSGISEGTKDANYEGADQSKQPGAHSAQEMV